jgi:hypothetical protein
VIATNELANAWMLAVNGLQKQKEGVFMGQTVTPEIIVSAFEFMGGDPSTAIESARGSSIESWKYWQATQAAAVGAAAVAIPGAHIPLIVVDVAFLLHKMAYCCWGIGALHKCEIESKEDFAVILGLYAGVVSEHALAASVGMGTLALTGGIIANAGLPAFVAKVAGKGAGMGAKALGTKLGTKAVGKALAASSPLIGAVSGKLAEKLTAKFATKAFIKSASNFVAGFLPVVGVAAGGAINAYFVLSIASSAETYYRIKKRATGG